MSSPGEPSTERPVEQRNSSSQLTALVETFAKLDLQLRALPSEALFEPWRTELGAALERAEVQILSETSKAQKFPKLPRLEQSPLPDHVPPRNRGEEHEILARVIKWAGGVGQAYSWYHSEPLAAFGDRTAESLVKSGQAEALRDYLDSIALGGYA